MSRGVYTVDCMSINECQLKLLGWIGQIGQQLQEHPYRLDKICTWQFIPYHMYGSPGQRFLLILEVEATPLDMFGQVPPESIVAHRLPHVGEALGMTLLESAAIARDPEINTWNDLVNKLEKWLSHARTLASQAQPEGE